MAARGAKMSVISKLESSAAQQGIWWTWNQSLPASLSTTQSPEASAHSYAIASPEPGIRPTASVQALQKSRTVGLGLTFASLMSTRITVPDSASVGGAGGGDWWVVNVLYRTVSRFLSLSPSAHGVCRCLGRRAGGHQLPPAGRYPSLRYAPSAAAV